MNCPHCKKQGRSLVTETRTSGDAIYRRRSCGFCGSAFVTQESAPPGLKMPAEHNNRPPATAVVRTKEIRSTGIHLQNIW